MDASSAAFLNDVTAAWAERNLSATGRLTRLFPGSENESPVINTVGLVLVAVAVLAALAVAKIILCCRDRRGKASGGEHHTYDGERAVSSQILDLERLSAYGTPRVVPGEKTCVVTGDGNTVMTAMDDGTYFTYDGLTGAEPDPNSHWTRQCDLDRQSVSSCRTWLLESVDRLDVIVEESEASSNRDSVITDIADTFITDSIGSDQDTFITDSPGSHGEDSVSRCVDSELDCGDDSGSSLFLSCSLEDRLGALGTAFNETTTTFTNITSISTVTCTGDYKTCSQHTQPGCSLDQRSSPCAVGVQDDSHSSGTSGEVSSGCFDHSFVTFHTLPAGGVDGPGLPVL